MLHDPVILYVEDEPLSRLVMEMLLVRRLGYERVIIFESGERLIERIEALQSPPDLIFLDIRMRPFDGFEALSMLRSHPTLGGCRIIAVTASVMNEEVEVLKRSGFNGAIAKPIDQNVFPDLLGRILNGEEVWHVA